MMIGKIKKILLVLGLTIPLFYNVPSVKSQHSLNFGNYIKIRDKNIKIGHIIAISENGFVKSRVPYSPSMVGVVASKAGIAFEPETKEKNGYYPVIFSGTAEVLVSGENGAIHKGDFITSSSLPGIGMRATHSGPMLGVALADFKGKTKEEIGKIPVSLNIRYVSLRSSINSRLKNVFNLARLAAYEEPLVAFKYIVAALSVILSFTFAFLHFGRVSAKGIEALGRNPLASRIIQIGIIFNILIGLGIMATGVAIGLLVLRF